MIDATEAKVLRDASRELPIAHRTGHAYSVYPNVSGLYSEAPEGVNSLGDSFGDDAAPSVNKTGSTDSPILMDTEKNTTAPVAGVATNIPGSEPEVQSRDPSNVAFLLEFLYAAGVMPEPGDTDLSKLE